MKLKQMVMAGSCALTLFAGSNLMAWGVQAWTPSGSNTTFFTSSDGRTGQAWTPSGSNTTFYSGSLFRGFTAWTPSGSNTTYFNGNGWSGTAWTPSGSNTTYFNFRGQVAKKLFANTVFAEKIDAVAIQDALVAKNVDALTSCAWDLKGLEIILGKKDSKTTSDMLFNAAAQIAVEQGNGNALKQIIALAPECKTFEAQLAMKTKTRGANKSVCALPQLCLLPPKDYKKAIDSLTMWQQPMFGDYICQSFRGMSKQSADTASMLVNEGRITMNPQMIAMGALELSKYPYNSELGIKFEPAQIFAEAVELAIVKQDKAALTQLAALYNTASFKSEECAKYIQSELAMLSGMRGMKPNAKCTPGDFGPADFHKLIRTVYFEDPETQEK